jgi:hypothetical protein
LEVFSNIVSKYQDESRIDRFLYFGMSRSRLDDLKEIEAQMGVVLQLLVAHDAAEIKSILEECRSRLVRCDRAINSGTAITLVD